MQVKLDDAAVKLGGATEAPSKNLLHLYCQTSTHPYPKKKKEFVSRELARENIEEDEQWI